MMLLGMPCGPHATGTLLLLMPMLPWILTARHSGLGGSHIAFEYARGCDGFPIVVPKVSGKVRAMWIMGPVP